MAFDRSRLASLAAVTIAALTLSDMPASAQNENFFEMLFGGRSASANMCRGRPVPSPTRTSPTATSANARRVRRPPEGAGLASPIACGCATGAISRSSATPMRARSQLCNAFCPAAKTQVFNGSQIDHAYAGNGQRYADLDNAFVYRQKIVEGCSCNGKDSFGLARIDVAADPTLRPGDIVATGDNVKAALIAMHAAKERGLAAAERPALRGSRTATSAPAAARRKPPPRRRAPVPSEATDDIPED